MDAELGDYMWLEKHRGAFNSNRLDLHFVVGLNFIAEFQEHLSQY